MKGEVFSMIELEGIERTYTRQVGEPVRALREVSLRIERGEFLAVVGASGSGKSTLMNVLGLLDRPDAGRYLLDGEDISHLGIDAQARLRNRRIGFVFQSFHLLPRTSALENVELPLLYSDRASVSGLGRRALEAVGLADRIDHKPSELSGGQQQRVAIARALVNEPDLLLADEPTGNLDERAAGEIMDIFHTLHAAGRTIVLVTHDPNLAAHCDRICRLEAGRLISDRRTPGGRSAQAQPAVLAVQEGA
jgi:ABC-type lipoprotein export system ATPase subunit